MENCTCKSQLWWEDFNSRKLGIPHNYAISHGFSYVLDTNNRKQLFSGVCTLLALLNKYRNYFVSFQEEQEARAKADKIKLALEKLKEAKIKKVRLKIVK